MTDARQLLRQGEAALALQRRIEGGPAGLAQVLSRGRWLPQRHLQLLSDKLKESARRPLRLIVSMPPRHGKSELASVYFPLWFLALNPEKRVMLASYEADIAATWGRRVRDLAAEHGKTIGVTLAEDSRAANRWNTATPEGGMSTSGVGGPMTGKGADLLLIDDPVKNAEEADSPTMRQRAWDWWTTTAYTRLEKGASVVIIMTRWHEDDLAGRLLEHMRQVGGDQWEVINLPALAEAADPLGRNQGEALWPEKYSADDLVTMRRTMGERAFNSLYQGRPAPEEGGMFKKAWWQRYDAPPARSDFTELFQSWDMTFKDTDGTDFVCGGVWGVKGRLFYLLDVEWARMDFVETCNAVVRLSKRWPSALAKYIEDKANGPAVISQLRGKVDGLIARTPKGSKRARAAAVTPLVQGGQVYLPRHAPWVDAFIEECAGFPNGAHDDAVDMTSQALNEVMHSEDDTPPPPPKAGSPEWHASLNKQTQDFGWGAPQVQGGDGW